jgi:hypothetical protein
MSSVKNKLYNYEQTPPAKVWDKIAAALDESHIADQFPSTLYNAEATPPASTWNKIAAALPAETGKVVPLSPRRFNILRYAAAAAIIGILALGIAKWTGTGSSTISTDGEIVKKDNVPQTDTGNNTSTDNGLARENITNENQPAEETNDLIASEDRVKINKKIKSSYAVSNNINSNEPVYAYNEHTSPDRYVMLMTPNGIVRVSKKLGDMVCCVAGEEQDEDCKDQLKRLHEKMATSPGDNFMDILNLASSLNENDL